MHSKKTKAQHISNMPTHLRAPIPNNLTIIILQFFSMYNAHAESIMHIHHLLINASNSTILILLTPVLMLVIWPFCIINNTHVVYIMHILHLLGTCSSIPILILLTTVLMLVIWPVCSINNTYAVYIMHILQLLATGQQYTHINPA